MLLLLLNLTFDPATLRKEHAGVYLPGGTPETSQQGWDVAPAGEKSQTKIGLKIPRWENSALFLRTCTTGAWVHWCDRK
jgi:hypothetical protein